VLACRNMAPVSLTALQMGDVGLRPAAAGRLACVVCALVFAGCAGTTARVQPDRVTAEAVADGVSVTQGGQPVLFYRTRPQAGREPWRINYIHPLHSAAGAVITEDGPPDHPHQRGVYWAWRRILIDGVRVADGWVGEGLSFEVTRRMALDRTDGSAQIDARLLWRVPLAGQPTDVVAESSRITVYPLVDGLRRVDLEVRLRALRRGVAIAGTDDEKGYGGISLRFGNGSLVQLAGDGRELLATPAAMDAGASVEFRWPALPAPWPARVAARCTVDGRPWTRWVLRQEPSMQNCAYPGSSPVELPTDRDLVLAVTLDIA
jgi:hypothetical protein